jgi:hypothetical protein
MRIASITIALLLIVSSNAVKHDAYAQSQKPQATHGVGPTGTPCLFDFERGEVPNCLRESATGDLSIAPELVNDLAFDSHGLAAVRSPKEGWMYVSRSGKVVIKGVPVMDNGADAFHDGLVRIVRNGKYGFANRAGQIVIPTIYDGAMNFENGSAAVCKGCQTSREGEYHFFSGGDWFRINTKGTTLARIHPNAR